MGKSKQVPQFKLAIKYNQGPSGRMDRLAGLCDDVNRKRSKAAITITRVKGLQRRRAESREHSHQMLR